jgi:hypothetical protein
MPHGHYHLGRSETPRSPSYDRGRFGRLFTGLPPFADDTQPIRDALAALGHPGGPMDAGDDLSDALTLITDPSKSANNPNNPALTAGFTFLGQFLDHDMTFDPTSSLARRQDPESIRNFRIPALDLDSVYGGGPIASPHLYDSEAEGRTKFLIEEIPGSAEVTVDGRPHFDLPRNSQQTALLGDPRNDENLVISQLHLALLRFHNHVVDDLASGPDNALTPGERFAEAQRIVRWHYQWLIIHEFLPGTVGQDVVDEVLCNWTQALLLAAQPLHPRRILGSRVSIRPFPGPPELPCELRDRRQGPVEAVLRDHLRPDGPQEGRSRRPQRRGTGASPVHRLADLLRLRGRQRPPQQEDRHHAVDAALRVDGPAAA